MKDWLCENSLMVASPQRKSDIATKGDLDIFSGLSFEERKEILQMQQLHDKELINLLTVTGPPVGPFAIACLKQ